MKTFAQVFNNTVIGIVSLDDIPTTPFVGEMVDITLVSPQPKYGWTYDGVTFSVDLEELKQDAKAEIDSAAESARGRYLTFGSGQAITYQEKADEATDYVAAGYPVDLSGYPFIQAEVNATGKTSAQSADDILVQRSAWIAAGAQIEQERIGGKLNIDAADTSAEIEIIKDNAVAALDLL